MGARNTALSERHCGSALPSSPFVSRIGLENHLGRTICVSVEENAIIMDARGILCQDDFQGDIPCTASPDRLEFVHHHADLFAIQPNTRSLPRSIGGCKHGLGLGQAFAFLIRPALSSRYLFVCFPHLMQGTVSTDLAGDLNAVWPLLEH